MDIEKFVLQESKNARDAGNPMSIEEIANMVGIEHKRILGEIARYNTSQVRLFGSKNWGSGHVIQDLKSRAALLK